MALETTLRLLGGIVLVAANAFFVATEFALTRVRQFPKAEFEGHAGLRRAWKMTEELEIYLTGCQVGITFTSILLGIIVEPAVTRSMEPMLAALGVSATAAHGAGLVVGLVLINLVHTIWAEQAPTYLGIEKSKLVVKYCAIPHFWWTRLVYPLLIVGDGMAKWTLRLFGIEMRRSWTQVGEGGAAATPGTTSTAPTTRAEMIQQMGSLLRRGNLPPDRRREVLQAVKIDDMPVTDAVVPRSDVVVLRADESFADSARKIGESKKTRYPLVDDDLDQIIGVVYLPALFAHLDQMIAGDKTLQEIAMPPLYVDASLALSDLIDRFQEAGHELAVVQHNGAAIGIVTLTDAVEVMIGQVEDPLDRELSEA